MMVKRLAIIGVVISAIALLLGALLILTNWRAQSRDRTEQKHGVVVSDFAPCVWEVDMPQRVLSENDSTTVVARTTNRIDVECQSELTLLAPGFEISPRKDVQLLKARPNGAGSIAWILVPRSIGSFEFALTDGIDTRTVGVTVTNTFGLTATQSQFVSVLGSLFGPMLTVPWWFERWQQRKRSPVQKTTASKAPAPEPPESPAQQRETAGTPHPPA